MKAIWTKIFSKKKKSKKGDKTILEESNIYMSVSSTGDEGNPTFLYDFIKERFDGNRWSSTERVQDGQFLQPETRILEGNLTRGTTIGGEFIPLNGTFIDIERKDLEIKIELKPIDVLHELERVPSSWSTVGIDEKIIILQEKGDLIKNHYAKKEVFGMIERLQNRKKYFLQSKTGETFKEFFTKYDSTTEEKIDELLKNHSHLSVKDSDLFIPEFPNIAIQIMKQYTEKCLELCGKKPVFQVIAPTKLFKEKYKKRDPILLVQSPFGYYFDILGAWDEEMILLGSL